MYDGVRYQLEHLKVPVIVKALKHKTGYLGFGVTAPQATLMVIMPPPLQGKPRSYPEIPPFPPYIQHGCESCHLPLGNVGGGNRGGNGGTLPINMGLCGILLC